MMHIDFDMAQSPTHRMANGTTMLEQGEASFDLAQEVCICV